MSQKGRESQHNKKVWESTAKSNKAFVIHIIWFILERLKGIMHSYTLHASYIRISKYFRMNTALYVAKNPIIMIVWNAECPIAHNAWSLS